MLSPFLTTKHQLFFSLLDQDDNGYLDVKDFTDIADKVQQTFMLSDDDPDTQRLKKTCIDLWKELSFHIDENNDGKATFEEWMDYANEKIVTDSSGKTKARDLKIIDLAEQLFLLFDEDHDNQISLDEYVDFFVCFHLDVVHSAKAFAYIDKNSDQQLTRNELLLGLIEFFTSDDQSAGGNWIFGDPFSA